MFRSVAIGGCGVGMLWLPRELCYFVRCFGCVYVRLDFA